MITQSVWERAQAGDSRALDDLARAYHPLVGRIVRKFARRLPPHADWAELESAGNAGLLRALLGYDPTSPVQFEAYAQAIIRSTLLDSLRAQDWAPRSLRRQQREAARMETELRDRLHRTPTVSELADALDWTVQQVNDLRVKVSNSHHRSLDELMSPDPDRPTTPEPQAQDTTESLVLVEILRLVVDQISQLPPTSQAVLALHYFEGRRLSAIGEVLGLSEARVSAIHSQAVFTVREIAREHHTS